MDGYFNNAVDEQSPIDRAFGSGGSGLASNGGQQQHDGGNHCAPMPRKRPVATPAVTSVGVNPGVPVAAANTSQISSVSAASDGRGGTANTDQREAGIQHQMHELQQQMAQGAGTADPVKHAMMFQRMTGLMAELQSIMDQMVPPHQQQQQTPHHASGEVPGLRRNAQPFEPSSNSTHGGYGRGGYSHPRGYGTLSATAPQYYSQNTYPGVSIGATYPSPSRHVWGAAPSAAQPRPSQGCVLCFVEFKRGRMKRYESDAFIAPGNYIIVEGDRGEDCGLVVHTFQRLPDGSIGRSETLEGISIDVSKIKPETGRVRRVAVDAEVNRLHGDIATLERHALKTCRERVEAMGLNMDVVDCEYQFDRKKITFFFDAPSAVDFRELTKDLFKHFGARIWLENINSKVKNVVPDGALSHADKLLYSERGLRPPRR